MKARVQRGRAQLRELLRACCRIELDRRGQITELERSRSIVLQTMHAGGGYD